MTEILPHSIHEQMIREWLAEYKSLPKSSLDDYAKNIRTKEKLLQSFHVALISSKNPSLIELIQPLCHQLFEFYRSGLRNLRMFAISAFPSMVGAYLKLCSTKKEETNLLSISIGTFLLSVYKLMCGNLKVKKYANLFSEDGVEIPNMVQSSVYHDCMANPFSERTLSMPRLSSNGVSARMPTPICYSSILPSNRNKILYTVMNSYLDRICYVMPSSLNLLCEICLFIGCYGYPWQQMYLKHGKTSISNDRRFTVSTDFCIVILRCVYYALYNRCRSDAVKAVQAMQKRARYEVSSQMLLLCNGILTAVYHEKQATTAHIPLGLSTAVTPMFERSSSRVKHIVTAKSIKHHKWMHVNEEVSGDYSECLTLDASSLDKIPSTLLETEDTNTKDKDTITLSPAKILKSKMKKSAPFPSSNSPVQKSRSFQSNEKKGKKSTAIHRGEDTNAEGRSRTPSGGQKIESYGRKVSSTSVPSIKLIMADDNRGKALVRSNSITKNINDIDGAVTAVDLVIPKNTDVIDNTISSSKKNKSEKSKKLKSIKDVESKEFLKTSKSKEEVHVQAETVPLLEGDRKPSVDENKTSITTAL